MIDKDSSERLNILRFPLIVGVVYIHAYATSVGFSTINIGITEASWISDFIRDLISQGFARVAVPLFFLMSGYLFFIRFAWSIENYKNKLLSRTRSLLIPFLFWNMATLLLLAIAQSIPTTQGFFSGNSNSINDYSMYDYFNALFGIDRFPISYQFWFIRDLMILILLVPVIHFTLKYIPKNTLVVISVLWFFNLWPIYMPSAAAFYFFYMGAFLAVSDLSLFKLDKYGSRIIFLYIIIQVIDALTKGAEYNGYLHRVCILLGMVTSLYLTKFILRSDRVKSYFLWAAGASFFVFATHEPLLTITRKITYKLFTPDSNLMTLALYIGIPIFVIGVSVTAYVLLKSIMPKTINIISGSR